MSAAIQKKSGKLIGMLFLLMAFVLIASPSWGDSILEFDTMVGVSGPFVGSSNPIRGINGGGLPWDIEEEFLSELSPIGGNGMPSGMGGNPLSE